MASTKELAARLSVVVATQQEVLAAITDVDKVMAIIVERTPEATSGTGAIIERLEGDVLVYGAASGAAKDRHALRLSLSESLSGVAVRERAVVRCDDSDSDPRVDATACHAIGIRSLVVAPLMEGTAAVGVLLSFSNEAHAFSDLDAYVLQLLAGMTAAALAQARMFRELEVSDSRYRMLFDRNVAGVFRSTLDGRILDCNESLVQYLGYDSREELLALPAWDLYHQRTDREELIRLVQQNQTMLNIRMPFRRKDGTSLLGMISAGIVRSNTGEPQMLGTIVEA